MRTLNESNDPIFDAIADYRQKEKTTNKLYDALDLAELNAQEKHGRRPWSLISWRRYSAIGGSEIDRARNEFMNLPGADPQRIEQEYRDAKARLRALERAEKAWDRRAGIDGKRREYEQAHSAEIKALMAMARTKPQTAAGAAALLALLRTDMEIGSHPWQDIALGTVVQALRSIDARVDVSA